MQTVPTESLPDIVTPTLFIHGQLDKRVTAKDLKATAQTMPQAQVAVIEAGHWPMRARPALFNPLVLDFLSQSTRQPIWAKSSDSSDLSTSSDALSRSRICKTVCPVVFSTLMTLSVTRMLAKASNG